MKGASPSLRARKRSADQTSSTATWLIDRTPEEGYHFMADMTDRAIGWVRSQQALMPDKPFFCYFAPGATHAPHHVPKEWADRYEGSFDQGWDRLREEIFARQKKLGVIPQNCELTRRHTVIPAWEDMPAELKPFLTRQMEVYAGYLSYADHHVGRLIDAIEQLGVLDDTLVYYIIGDNGASPEGTVNGTFNEYVTTINLRPELETPTAHQTAGSPARSTGCGSRPAWTATTTSSTPSTSPASR